MAPCRRRVELVPSHRATPLASGTAVAAIAILVALPPAASALHVAIRPFVASDWTELPPPVGAEPYARAYAAVGSDPVQGVSVLFGGVGASGSALGDTWVNDADVAGGWTAYPFAAGAAPPTLRNASLVWDPGLGEFVLFGGTTASGGAYGGTWTFGNFSWTNVSAVGRTFPPAVATPWMGYDARDRAVVLWDLRSMAASTWVYLKGGWLPVVTAGPPTNLLVLAVVTDAADGAVLLFGSVPANGTAPPALETWAFAELHWTLLDSSTAVPLTPVAFATYDPRVVGTVYLASEPTSTWEFANGTWANVSTGAIAPSDRFGAVFYFDHGEDAPLLFGGEVPGIPGVLSDVWGWRIPPPPVDATVAVAPLPWSTYVEAAAAFIVPFVAVLLLRRRPPRRLPATVPRPTPSTAGI